MTHSNLKLKPITNDSGKTKYISGQSVRWHNFSVFYWEQWIFGAGKESKI